MIRDYMYQVFADGMYHPFAVLCTTCWCLEEG